MIFTAVNNATLTNFTKEMSLDSSISNQLLRISAQNILDDISVLCAIQCCCNLYCSCTNKLDQCFPTGDANPPAGRVLNLLGALWRFGDDLKVYMIKGIARRGWRFKKKIVKRGCLCC